MFSLIVLVRQCTLKVPEAILRLDTACSGTEETEVLLLKPVEARLQINYKHRKNAVHWYFLTLSNYASGSFEKLSASWHVQLVLRTKIKTDFLNNMMALQGKTNSMMNC